VSIPELDNLVRIRKLSEEPSAASEIAGLVASARARLADAEKKSLHLESRFDLAYNAAHALALAALRWHGYRSDTRYLVFQCAKHTLGLPAEKSRILDDAHRKGNLAEYEGRLDVDTALVDALVRAARELERLVDELGPLESR
jgi:hypothetical protein